MLEEIQPPSAARETWAVTRAAFAVIAASLCVIAAGRPRAEDAAAAGLQPFQARAATLDRASQATFRALAAALPELEATRVEGGRWPEPAVLAAQGVPPFTAPELTWSLRVEGSAVGYLGRPQRGPAFLLQIVEPTAPTTGRPVADETHHRLADGRWIHVGTWVQAAGDATLESLERPMLSGWIQYLAAPPRPEAAP